MTGCRKAPDQTKAIVNCDKIFDKIQLKTLNCSQLLKGTRMDSNHSFKTHKTKSDVMDKSTTT